MADLVKFHARLFGPGAGLTAREALLFKAHEERGCCGFDSDEQSIEDLRAVTTIALHLAREALRTKSDQPVVFLVPTAWYTWTVLKLKTIATAIVRLYKGNVPALQSTREAFRKIHVTHKARLIPATTKNVVVLGFRKDAPIPTRLRDLLLTV